MKRNLLFILVAMLGLSGCAQDGIPLLGMDDSGSILERYASDEEFREELTKATSQVNHSTFTALRSSGQDQSGMLRTVVVGLGFTFQGGLGPFITASAQPKVRFGFSNSKKPITP